MSEATVIPDEIADSFREVAQRLRTDPKRFPGQYVYVFKAGDHVKIGIASDPYDRWKAIATCNPLLEEDGFVTDRKFANAKYVETRIHARLAEFRFRNEWFACSIETAVAAVREITRERNG